MANGQIQDKKKVESDPFLDAFLRSKSKLTPAPEPTIEQIAQDTVSTVPESTSITQPELPPVGPASDPELDAFIRSKSSGSRMAPIKDIIEFNRINPMGAIGEYKPGFTERAVTQLAQLPKRLMKQAAKQLGPSMTMDAIMASSGMTINAPGSRNPLTNLKKTLSQEIPEAEGWKEVAADIVGDLYPATKAWNLSKAVTQKIAQETVRRLGRGALASMVFDLSENKNISIAQAGVAAGIDAAMPFGSKVMNMARQLKSFKVPRGIDDLFPGAPVAAAEKTASRLPYLDVKGAIEKAKEGMAASKFNTSRMRVTSSKGVGITRKVDGLYGFGDIPQGRKPSDYKFMMFDPVDDVIYADDLMHMGGWDGLIKSGAADKVADDVFGRSISLTVDETGQVISAAGELAEDLGEKAFMALRRSGFNFEQLEKLVPKNLAMKTERVIQDLTKNGDVVVSPAMFTLRNTINKLMHNKDVSHGGLYKAMEDGWGINDMKFIGENSIPREAAETIVERLNQIEKHWPQATKDYFLKTGQFPLEPYGFMGRSEIGKGGRLIRSARFLGYKWMQSLETTLGKLGANSQEMRDRTLKAMAWQDGENARAFKIIDDVFDLFDGDHDAAAEFMKQYEAGTIETGSSKLFQDAAAKIGPWLDEMGTLAEVLRFQVRQADGTLAPFRQRKNFLPHGFDFDDLHNKNTQEALIKRWMDDGLTRGQAGEELNRLAAMKKTRLDPNLEHQRVHNVGGWIGDPNSASFTIEEAKMGLKRYASGANRRLSEGAFMDANGKHLFGPQWKSFGELAGEEVDRDVQSFLFDAVKRIKGVDAGEQEHLFLATLRNYQVANKLGLAAIPNFFQVAITVLPKTSSLGLARGIKNTYKGINEMLNDSSFAVDVAGAAMAQAQREALGLSTGGFSGKLAKGVLKWSGFSALERANNIIAAGAGRAHLLDAFDIVTKGEASPLLGKGVRLQGSPKAVSSKSFDRLRANARIELTNLGISKEAIARGFLTPEEISEASWRMARLTQFRGSALDLPLFWTSPYGKLVTQFKTFGFNINKLMWQHAVKPMARYVRSGGKEGTPVPLMTMMATTFASGEAIAAVRGMLINGKDRPDEWYKRIGEDLAWGGSLGMYMDLFQAGVRGRAIETLAGPTLSDLNQHIKLLSQGEILESARLATPVIRSIGRTKQFTKKSNKRSTFP